MDAKKIYGNINVESSNTFLEFYDNSYVKYEKNVGTESYYSMESQFKLDNDWSLYDNGKVSYLSGHIQFIKWERESYNEEPTRFGCQIGNDELTLVSSKYEGVMLFLDPRMIYVRVK